MFPSPVGEVSNLAGVECPINSKLYYKRNQDFFRSRSADIGFWAQDKVRLWRENTRWMSLRGFFEGQECYRDALYGSILEKIYVAS